MDVLETRVDSFDGAELFCRVYRHPFPRGLVLIVHGYCEHSGRYQHLAEHLMLNGFSCLAYDQRAHGQSSGKKGLITDHKIMTKDLSTIVNHIKTIEPGVPVFLLGHSGGGVVVALQAAEWDLFGGVAGIILCSTAISKGENAMTMGFMRLAASFMPHMPLFEGTSLAGLSRDPEVKKKILQDPYFLKKKLTAKSGFEIYYSAVKIRKAMAKIKLPTLILHGTGDQISNPKSSEFIYDRISSVDKTLLTYDGLYHEILNEYGKEAVMRDITDWLLARASGEIH